MSALLLNNFRFFISNLYLQHSKITMYNFTDLYYRLKVWQLYRMSLIAGGVLLLSLVCEGQDRIEGIGPFKIGTGIDLIGQIAKELNTKIIVVNNNGLNSKTPKIAEYKPNSINPALSPYGASLCTNVRVFCIQLYKVSGISLDGIRLTYLDNKLIELSVDSSTEIENALSLKYGEPTMSERSSRSYCEGMEDKTYSKRWENEDIKAIVVFSKYYEIDCKAKYTNQLLLYSETQTAIKMDCENKIEKTKIDKEKKALKDF